MDKAYIIKLLETNDKAICRALVVLNERQTLSEQSAQYTINRNGEGFTPADAYMGTSMAQFFIKRGYLTEKQLAYWKKPNSKGVMRICKYAGQLLEIANTKSQSTKSTAKTPVGDIGNMMEELMVLEEQYGDYQDSDDFPTLERMAENIALLKKEIFRATQCRSLI